MSTITEVIMLAPSAVPMDRVNTWLRENQYPELKRIEEHAGGNKVFCYPIYAAAINYLDTAKFVSSVRKIYSEVDKYEQPILLVKEEHSINKFTAYIHESLVLDKP